MQQGTIIINVLSTIELSLGHKKYENITLETIYINTSKLKKLT